MADKCRTGELRHVLGVLSIISDGQGGWDWETERVIHGAVEVLRRPVVYSNLAQSAQGVRIELRRQSLQPTQALNWKGRHIHISAILPEGRDRMVVEGALVDLVPCVALPTRQQARTAFPGILGLRYLSHSQGDPYAQGVTGYVLTTPREIVLQRGSLVEAGGTRYVVQTHNATNAHQQEYELWREEDL